VWEGRGGCPGLQEKEVQLAIQGLSTVNVTVSNLVKGKKRGGCWVVSECDRAQSNLGFDNRQEKRVAKHSKVG
jgi:hypothetical protein